MRLREPMQASSASGRAGWPVLMAVQVVVVMALGLAWLRLAPDEVETEHSVGERLRALDPSKEGAALAAAARRTRASGELRPEDERVVRSFIALAAQGVGMDDVQVDFGPGIARSGLRPCDVRIAFRGDVYDVPPAIEAVHRQQAIGVAHALRLDVAQGGAATGTLVVRFWRSDAGDTAWIADRVQSEVGAGAAGATAVMNEAASLAAARVFTRAEPAMARASRVALARLARELPAHLIALRRDGGRLTWSAADGARTVSPAG